MDEYKCIDLKCSHYDGDICLRGECDPLIYEDKCICALRVEDGVVTPNPDCPVHGVLHGKNPYKETP